MVNKLLILIFLSVFISIFCILFTNVSNYQIITQARNEYTHLSPFAGLILLVASIKIPNRNYQGKQVGSKKHDYKGNWSDLSLFKGREAKLNRIIFLVLFKDSPLVVYDITKTIRKTRGFRSVRYTNINRRVRLLANQGYLEVVGSRETQSGIPGILYQPTNRAKTAFFLNAVNADEFIQDASDEALNLEMAAIVLFIADNISQK